jgi:predicted O-methyltransferase YrrM
VSFAIRDRIIALHGPGVLKRSALSIRGGAHVFERVMGGKGYRTALEIGTYRGVAAAEMSRYCEHVVTIDLRYGKLEKMNESFDRAEFWNSLGVENVELLLVDDDAEKRRLVDGLEFDFAFIDGAHDATVKNDFDTVKRCGRVLFHDYDRRGVPDQDHVCDFVDTLPRDEIEVLDIFALWCAPK